MLPTIYALSNSSLLFLTLTGSLLAWTIPLAAAPAGAAPAGAQPQSARLPAQHNRSVFSIRFGPLPLSCGMATTSMDRSAAVWQLGKAPPQAAEAWKAVKVAAFASCVVCCLRCKFYPLSPWHT